VAVQNASIMDRLREATSEQHRNAESRRLQREMVRGELSADAYAAWLGQMLLLHGALHEAIADGAGRHPHLRRIVRDEGRHVSNLRSDLALLGLDADRMVPLPATAGAIEAITRTGASDALSLLGYNYVLEGSMNGNRFIARALLPKLSVPAVSYLDPYGEDQRPAWQAYRERMNAAGFGEEEGRRMVDAARDMFAFIAAMSDELMEPAAA